MIKLLEEFFIYCHLILFLKPFESSPNTTNDAAKIIPLIVDERVLVKSSIARIAQTIINEMPADFLLI